MNGNGEDVVSAQFGRWSLRNPSDEGRLAYSGASMAAFGPDGRFNYRSDDVEIDYYAFHTTPEAKTEKQPLVLASGEVFTWNGRLDNRKECLEAAGGQLAQTSPDVAIAAGCYTRLGSDCFRRFLGDWAISIWNPAEQFLLLARDSI